MSVVYYIVICLVVCVLWFSVSDTKIKYGSIAAVVLLSYIMYVSYFEQMFAKQYGGTQVTSVANGEQFIGISWKDDGNWWIITHEVATNTCYYRENSKYSAIEGTIKIKNCNPI